MLVGGGGGRGRTNVSLGAEEGAWQTKTQQKGTSHRGEGTRCQTKQGTRNRAEHHRHRRRQIKKTQDELQWIVAQRLLSALTIPGFS